jgi:hypothetical protein
MDPTPSYRPRVSRETRLLITTALVAVTALWVLARIRFPDLPAAPTPVPTILPQLVATPSLDGVATEVAQLQAKLEPVFVSLNPGALTSTRNAAAGPRVTAIRLRDDLAVTLMPVLPSPPRATGAALIALDPASGLAVVRVPAGSVSALPAPWTPRRLDRPQFLMATTTIGQRTTLHPVFIALLEPMPTALWPSPLWSVPQSVNITPGSFLFTTIGDFVGMVIERGGRRAIVPAPVVLAEAERLVADLTPASGDVGIHVQSLTPDLAAATGAKAGVIVTSVDPGGVAGEHITTGDVLESVNGQPLRTAEEWRVRMARLRATELLSIRIRRAGQTREVHLQAPVAPLPPERSGRLGLRLRRAAKVGSEVLAVDPGTAADRAGLIAGDRITLIGTTTAPTPAQVEAAFAAAEEGKPILVGIMRGATTMVTTLSR